MFFLVILRLVLGFGMSPAATTASARRPRLQPWFGAPSDVAVPQGGLTSVGLHLPETNSGPPGRRPHAVAWPGYPAWCSLFGLRPRVALCAIRRNSSPAAAVSPQGCR